MMQTMCDTIAIVRPGLVLFAKNSDRDPNEAQALDWIPRQTHTPGSSVRCTWLDIPQARATFAVLLSRPFWMWGAEIGANEHGVVIGNEAVFTRQPYAKTGLTGMDLLRLALERSPTAAKACDTIRELIVAHGQGGGCGHENRSFTYHNSFIIADPNEAFVLETAGRESAVERISGARTISNGLTIPGFAEKHSDWLKTKVSACRLRQARTSSRAENATSLADLAAILSDHGDGDVPNYHWTNGGMSFPCMHAGGRLAASQTTASWITALHPDRVEHWVTATAAPCTSFFKPVELTSPLPLGPWPTDQFDSNVFWWRHELLHRLVMRNPGAGFRMINSDRHDLQSRWFRESIEPMEAFAIADRQRERWIKTIGGLDLSDNRPFWLRRYWKRRNVRACLPIESLLV
jgi:dipeptidase